MLLLPVSNTPKVLKTLENVVTRHLIHVVLSLNDNQLQKITTTYTRTGVLDIPPVVMKLSEISGELPIDIINRQIEHLVMKILNRSNLLVTTLN